MAFSRIRLNMGTNTGDARFRSFAERYFVTRSQFFRQDPRGLAEDTWLCILDAKRAYKLIKGVSYNAENGGLPEDQGV
jgi:hypothetical protein